MISETARNGGVRVTVKRLKRRIGCRNLLSRVTVGVDAVSQSQASTPKCQKEHGGGRSGALGSPQELLHSHLHRPLKPWFLLCFWPPPTRGSGSTTYNYQLRTLGRKRELLVIISRCASKRSTPRYAYFACVVSELTFSQ